MCLDVKNRVVKKVRVGYKVMYPTFDGLYQGQYYHAPGCSKYDVGCEYSSSEGKILYGQNWETFRSLYYPAGFHVYTKLPRTGSYSFGRVVKVKVREIVASGTQQGKQVVVARKMTILGEVDEKGRLLK